MSNSLLPCYSHEGPGWNSNSLNTLSRMVCSINAANTQQDLLDLFINQSVIEFNATAGVIRLLTDHGWMELVACANIAEDLIKSYRITPIEGSLFSRDENILTEQDPPAFAGLFGNAQMTMLTIPIRHHICSQGVINLFLTDPVELSSEECRLMLETGKQLGIALDRFHHETEARQKLVQQERNMLANELHDSLAQTMASLRFQVRILDEMLQRTSEYKAINSIEQVEQGLDEAYTDLRELIAHCRVPIEDQGLLPSIERAVARFREETGIHILLQSECQSPEIPADKEMNVIRIVQEALTNIKKHADAKIVRVLLQCNDSGEYHILIENDGKGFDKSDIQSEAGRHLGLTIMQERARHIGGELRIESEPDEGTRIELSFSSNEKHQNQAHNPG
jgi:two-component system, NarL family, nitrate/nitrite sensor histidine kinase NarX